MSIPPTLAIDFGGTAIKLAMTHHGTVLATAKVPTTSQPGDLAAVERKVAELMDTLGVAKPGAIGIALPGVIDPNTDRLLAAPQKYEYAIDLDMTAWATHIWQAPAAIENDGRAALIGELAYGCARGGQDVVMVILGTGIGTAACVQGMVLRGASGHAGILGGHCTIDLDGPRCPCGNVGCAEALASTWALADQIRSQPGFAQSGWPARIEAGRIGFDQVVARLGEDPLADAVFDHAVRAWGAATVTLCHAYDPQLVVLSGGIARCGQTLVKAIEGYVHSHLWSSCPRPRFALPADPECSVLLGLSYLAERML